LLLSAAAALSVAFTAATAQDASHSKTRIMITYDEIDVPVDAGEPIHRLPRAREYVLSGSGHVVISAQDMRRAPGVMTLGAVRDNTAADSRPYKVTFRVLDGVLFIVTDWSTFVTVRKIYTDGENSCRSTLDFQKKNGAEYFEVKLPHGSRFYKDMHAENITCAIEAVAE
jgi:hypothetical protein